MAKTVETYAEAAATWIKNPGLMLSVIVFALVQLYVLGILPAIKNTYSVNITMQNNLVLAAEAKYADLRQQAEAKLQTEEAAINAEKAKNADRRTAAAARKATADAKTKVSEAFNSPELQTALTEIAQQEANINTEKAKQEDRKARALADKSHFESIINEANGRVAQAVARNRTIKANADAISACVNSYILSVGGSEGYGEAGDMMDAATGGNQRIYTEFRRACVKPSPPKTINPQLDSDVSNLNPKCREYLQDWQQNAESKGAFAISKTGGHCATSYNWPTSAIAQQHAMADCKKAWGECIIYQEK